MDTCTVFVAARRLATGLPEEVSSHLRALLRRNPQANCLVIDDRTGRFLELDGTGGVLPPVEAEIQTDQTRSSPGRPRLGVIAREVTLLPRHWEWLASQPGGASAVLRGLVEATGNSNQAREKASRSLAACQRAMAALANGLPNFEEACISLRSGNFLDLGIHMHDWPADIRRYLETFIATAWHDACTARNMGA